MCKKIVLIFSFLFLAFAVLRGGNIASRNSASEWAHIPDSFKSAKWVAPAPYGFVYEIVNSYNLYRKKFDLKTVPAKAPLYITADQSYRLYINGKFVCSGPARGFQHSWPFDEIDAAKYLKSGKNVLAIRQYNAGRGTFGYISKGHSGAIFALELGGGKTVLSDHTTKGRRQEGCDRNTAQFSVPMNNQEHIDLRMEDPRWKDVDFDDSKWEKCQSSRAFNSMPYYNFESRMIPMLEEYEIYPKKIVSQGVGKASSLAEKVFDSSKLADAEKLEFSAFGGGGLVAEFPPSKDGVRAFVFDFGVMSVGMPILKIEGAKGGEIIDIRTTELIENNADIVRCGSNLAPANRLVCREGTQIHDFYHVLGFRYLTVRVRNNPDSTLKIAASMRWSAYPLGDRGKFKTSNVLVNKIWRASRQTQRLCSLDSYVDTPYREQAQWWGDARVQAWNTFFISGDTRLLRRGIRSISMQKTPNGLTHGYAPDGMNSCVLPDYSLIWILSVWDYYWQTGDIEPFLTHKDTVDSVFAYFDSVTDSQTGLAKYDPRYWLFLDWCRIQKRGQPAVLNLWYLHSLDKMAQLCRENGLSADAEKYAARAAKLRGAIKRNLLLPNGLVSDGILEDGSVNPVTAIHAQTLAKICEIEGFDFQKALNEIILPYVRNEGKEKAPDDFNERMKKVAKPTSYWAVYILKVLCDAGYERDAYDYISRMWAEFADYGSVGEMFNVPLTSTHSHAWSAHPSFLLPMILGGVKQEAAGWTKISYKPNFFEKSADITYPTPMGDVKVSWRQNSDGTYTDNISAPKNMTVLKK